MIETWKDIPGYEGLYQVSDLGRVRSLDRIVIKNDGRITNYKSKILKHQKDRAGRLTVSLSKDSKVKKYYTYYLVALTFIGERPEGLEICHANGDFTDNRLSNIRYDTRSQNRIDNYRYGSKNSKGKLSIEQVLEIRRLHESSHYNQRELAKMFNVKDACISKIILKHTFKWLNDDGTIEKGA